MLRSTGSPPARGRHRVLGSMWTRAAPAHLRAWPQATFKPPKFSWGSFSRP